MFMSCLQVNDLWKRWHFSDVDCGKKNVFTWIMLVESVPCQVNGGRCYIYISMTRVYVKVSSLEHDSSFVHMVNIQTRV